jgi:hypothetical protein
MRTLLLISLFLAACTPVTDATTTSTAVTETTSTTSTTVTTEPTAEPASPESTPSTTLPDPRSWYLVSVTASLPDGLSDRLETIDGVDAVSTASSTRLKPMDLSLTMLRPASLSLLRLRPTIRRVAAASSLATSSRC